MNLISKLQNLLVEEKQVYNLSRNEEFAEFKFVGCKKTDTTIDFVAFVKADELTKKQILDLCDSFFQIIQVVSYDSGLKPLARNPNGLLCFVFEDNLSNHLIDFIKQQTKISNFAKSAVVVSWAIDVKNKQIYTHNNPVSLFPPVYIAEGWVFPGLDYLRSFLSAYDSQSVHTDTNTDKSLQSFEQLKRKMEEIEEIIKSTPKYQNQQDFKGAIASIIIQNITLIMNENTEVDMNFNAPVTGVAGKVEGNQNIYASEEKQTLAQAAEEIQKLLKQLEKTNPTATEEEKITYVNEETSSGFKKRTASALKAAGDTAIDEFLNRPLVKVVASGIKAWILPE
ncbi:MAG: hypothetical protein AAF316_10835 [Cyanobacteria bacterium P01_A01_bin.80]